MPEVNPPAAQAPARSRLEKDHVEVRVLKLGHDKIFTGEVGTDGPMKYKHGDKFPIHKDIAEAHENNGLVEIV